MLLFQFSILGEKQKPAIRILYRGSDRSDGHGTPGDIRYASLTFAVLNEVSELRVDGGRLELVIELLALTLSHPHSDHEARAQAQRILLGMQTDLKTRLSEDAYSAARQGAGHRVQSSGAEIARYV